MKIGLLQCKMCMCTVHCGLCHIVFSFDGLRFEQVYLIYEINGRGSKLMIMYVNSDGHNGIPFIECLLIFNYYYVDENVSLCRLYFRLDFRPDFARGDF